MLVYTKHMRNNEYIRTVIFGIEDSLVSTTGLIAGLAAGTSNKSVVIIGGVVAIAVEAISMGASEYISDDALNEARKRGRVRNEAAKSGILMLTAYFIAGLVPLLPVVFFDYPQSLYVSVLLAFAGIFTLGYVKGKVLHTRPLRGALKALFVGGMATTLGLIVGKLFNI